jgi:S1-C subfamily serine protease
MLVFAGAAAILVVGGVLSPRAPETAVPMPEPAAPLIEEQVRSEEPARLFDSLRGTLRGAIESTVAFEADRAPVRQLEASFDWRGGRAVPASAEGLGLIVSASEMLTSAAAVGRHAVLSVHLSDGRRVDGRVVVFDPEHDLALVQLAQRPRPAPLMLGALAMGQFVAAAGRIRGADFIVPAALAASDDHLYALDGVPPTMPAGTPIFDADGRAVGIIVEDARGPRVYAIGRALERTRALIAEGHAIPSATGLALQTIEPELEAFFGPGGVVISDLLPDSPAAIGGLLPGDVLQQIAGHDVTDTDAALRELADMPRGQPVALSISRRQRPRQITVTPDSVLDAPWLAAASRRAASTARRAGDVFAADVLDRAHIPADADILNVGGRRPVRVVHVTRPLLVYVDDRGTRRFAVVEPGP